MQVKELTKKYDGKAVVDSVSFQIPKGKVISLIGPNGAGKSTVMGILSRLIARDSGLVDFDGTDISRWKSRELSKRLAILTQTNNIQMKLTVRELVAFGRFPYSGSRLTPEDRRFIFGGEIPECAPVGIPDAAQAHPGVPAQTLHLFAGLGRVEIHPAALPDNGDRYRIDFAIGVDQPQNRPLTFVCYRPAEGFGHFTVFSAHKIRPFP